MSSDGVSGIAVSFSSFGQPAEISSGTFVERRENGAVLAVVYQGPVSVATDEAAAFIGRLLPADVSLFDYGLCPVAGAFSKRFRPGMNLSAVWLMPPNDRVGTRVYSASIGGQVGIWRLEARSVADCGSRKKELGRALRWSTMFENSGATHLLVETGDIFIRQPGEPYRVKPIDVREAVNHGASVEEGAERLQELLVPSFPDIAGVLIDVRRLVS